jgi:hypothetical protein
MVAVFDLPTLIANIEGPMMDCVADYCERTELIETWLRPIDVLLGQMGGRILVAEC